MPDVLHSSLTSTEVHEPKGVDTALEGEIYVADGAGGGAWQYIVSGWGFYKDGAAEQTFNTTNAKLSIDGADSIIETALPREIRGTGNLWDVTTDDITPIRAGDSYNVRLDLPVTARTSANYAEVTVDIGATGGVTIPVVVRRVEVSRTPPFTVSIGFPIYCLSTFVTNGGQIFIKTDTGSIGITAPGILLDRNHGEFP